MTSDDRQMSCRSVDLLLVENDSTVQMNMSSTVVACELYALLYGENCVGKLRESHVGAVKVRLGGDGCTTPHDTVTVRALDRRLHARRSFILPTVSDESNESNVSSGSSVSSVSGVCMA